MQISELLAQVQHHHEEAHAQIEELRRENELHRQRWVTAERKLVQDSQRHEDMRQAALGVTELFASKFPQCGHVVLPSIRYLTAGTHLLRVIVIEENSGCTQCGLLPAGHLL